MHKGLYGAVEARKKIPPRSDAAGGFPGLRKRVSPRPGLKAPSTPTGAQVQVLGTARASIDVAAYRASRFSRLDSYAMVRLGPPRLAARQADCSSMDRARYTASCHPPRVGALPMGQGAATVLPATGREADFSFAV